MTMHDADPKPTWSLAGHLTVMDVPDLKARMLAMIQGESWEIHLDLSQISSVDVAMVQALYSFHLSCIHAGKRMTIHNPSSAWLKRLEQMGIHFPWDEA